MSRPGQWPWLQTQVLPEPDKREHTLRRAWGLSWRRREGRGGHAPAWSIEGDGRPSRYALRPRYGRSTRASRPGWRCTPIRMRRSEPWGWRS